MLKPLSSKRTTKASTKSCKPAHAQHIVPTVSDYAAQFLKKHEMLKALHEKWLNNGGASDGGSNSAFWLYIEIKEKVLAMLPESQHSAGQKAFGDLDSLVNIAQAEPVQQEHGAGKPLSVSLDFTVRTKSAGFTFGSKTFASKPMVEATAKKKYSGDPIDWKLPITLARKQWAADHGKQYAWLLRDYDEWELAFYEVTQSVAALLEHLAGHVVTDADIQYVRHASAFLDQYFTCDSLDHMQAGNMLPAALVAYLIKRLDARPVTLGDYTVGDVARAIKHTPFAYGQFQF